MSALIMSYPKNLRFSRSQKRQRNYGCQYLRLTFVFDSPNTKLGKTHIWSQIFPPRAAKSAYQFVNLCFFSLYLAVDLHFEKSPPLRTLYENIGFFYRFSVDEKPKRIKSRRFQRIMRQWEAAIDSLSE